MTRSAPDNYYQPPLAVSAGTVTV